jgi:hypothetical protein
MRKRRVKSVTIILSAILVTACIVRFLFLPYWLENHLQEHSSAIEGYEVRYEDFSISLLTGSFTLHEVTLSKPGTNLPFPFFSSEAITVSLYWKGLLKGYVVSDISLSKPVVHFINGPDQASSQTGITGRWSDVMDQVAMVPINAINIRDGQIQYHDFHATPRVLLHMTDISLSATNLHNVNGEEKILSGIAEGSGKVMDADIRISVELNAFYKSPMFTLQAELTDLNLSDVRDFLKAYRKVEVQQGIFSLYTQASTRNNKVVGYVKPLIEDVTIASIHGRDEEINLIRPSSRNGAESIWVVTGGTSGNFNEIAFEGFLNDKAYNLWGAIGTTLHNAFLEALVTTLENTVNSPNDNKGLSPRPKSESSSVSNGVTEKKKGFLRKIFKRKETREKKQKNKDN